MSAKNTKEIEFRQKIVKSALYLAVEQGWEYTTLRDIADHAKVSPSDLYNAIDDKNDILTILGRIIDRDIMDNINITDDSTATPRDRLFDILMDRFDALNEYRDGVSAIFESFRYDPKQVIVSAPQICHSMGWMLEILGIETGGIKGAMKVAGLSALYIKMLKVWLEDESVDLSKTMASLDKYLERAEKAADTLGF